MDDGTLLLTGFAPFGGHAVNPSALLAERLRGATLGGLRVRSAVLAVNAATVGADVADLLASTQPLVVVALGMAAGRAALNVERVATNVLDFAIPDVVGAQPRSAPIVPDGPDAYLATVPVRAMVQAARAAGVPACLSNSAGTYLCNQALFLACHLTALASAPGATRPLCGFIHLPTLPEQAAAQPDLDLGHEGWPTMAIETMVRGVRAALAVAAEAALANQP